MTESNGYLKVQIENAVSDIIEGVDRDVERGEDILMLGFGIVMMSTFFVPVAPPSVLLPLVALTFAFSAGFARKNYHNIERKLSEALDRLEGRQKNALTPIAAVFSEHPVTPLTESFNPFKNLKRTGKSALGGFLINPLWMPIFYMMGMQICEEKKLVQLNKAIDEIEQRMSSNTSSTTSILL
ncbi:MAG: hypothetical protein ACU83N_08870 [Gammaproteobacteria bacterium]